MFRPMLKVQGRQDDSSCLLPPIHTDKRNALERAPKWLICIPLALQWIWLALRFHSFTLPSVVNPAITSGGLVGEGKLEYFEKMGPIAHAATAVFCSVSTDSIPSSAELKQIMLDAGLAFPIIAKPNLGLCGYGVRRLNSMLQLREYIARFPPNETIVLQEYLPQEGEAGIFYARHPESGEARIIGLTLRYFPQVQGDGVSTLQQLIARDPRAHRVLDKSKHTLEVNTAYVPAAGEVLRLSTVGSNRVGGLYRDGRRLITPCLVAAIDAIARDMPSFYCGRFDIRFDSMKALCEGKEFKIMEINGAGSEAIDAWDPDIGLLTGFKMIFAKQRLLFEIGNVMRKKGVKPIGLRALWRLNRRQQRLIACYPASN